MMKQANIKKLKKIWKRLLSYLPLVILAGASLTLSACGKDSTNTNGYPTTPAGQPWQTGSQYGWGNVGNNSQLYWQQNPSASSYLIQMNVNGYPQTIGSVFYSGGGWQTSFTGAYAAYGSFAPCYQNGYFFLNVGAGFPTMYPISIVPVGAGIVAGAGFNISYGTGWHSSWGFSF